MMPLARAWIFALIFIASSASAGGLDDPMGPLAADPNTKLLIEGHCDERGTEEYNRALGERRALAAREALAKMGVDPMRVFTRSYGKDKPMDMGHEEGAWTKNRRDEFVLLHPKNGETAPPANTMSGPQS